MISPSMKKILLQRTALHIFWLQFYPLKGSTYDNFCWCEWERVSCVIAAIRQGATVYLFLGYSKCCPHFFSWQGQMNFQWIPLPWTPFCGISLLITSQHWQSSLSAFLNDLKLSDQIASILPLLDIILAKANRKLSAVMLRVSSRFTCTCCTTRAFSASWNSFLMYKGPRKSILFCQHWGWCHCSSGRSAIFCTRDFVLK